MDQDLIPLFIKKWFEQKGWSMHDYQKRMFSHFAHHKSTLLIAPTGGGKTLAGFLPVLADIGQQDYKGLHTLYISPLKALTQDIRRNLQEPIDDMQLNIEIAIRTGDTSTYQRQKQLKKPPPILLTTPESLMLLLSHANAEHFFSGLKLIIIDELHSFSNSKRGDLTNLALAQLKAFAPQSIRFGLSATIAQPKLMAQWLAPINQNIEIIKIESTSKPTIHLIASENIPYGGYKAKYAIELIYQLIQQHHMTIIFVNTRANAEFLFNQLWICNLLNIPIAIYHGSLSKEQRLKTEQLCATGHIKAVVATSALELGIDWGNVDAVVQVGAPHGVSRLVQRIGRANHQFNKPSLAYLVPTNCFDTIESIAAIKAIAEGQLDEDDLHEGALDVLVQFIINCACSQPIKALPLLKVVRTAYPYRKLSKERFLKLFQFAIDGGYTLQHYPEYNRLSHTPKLGYIPTSSQVIRRHRQNIGTIIESPRLRVKVLNKRKDKIIGEVEEAFIQELVPGESFLFAGETLEYIQIHDMMVETRKIRSTNPKLPVYQGGSLPLSTFLADSVLQWLNQPTLWEVAPPKIKEWLDLQNKFSLIPNSKAILIEQFPYKKNNCLVIYSFEGRRANQSLGLLLTRRMEHLGLKPLSFAHTDYGLAINTLKRLDSQVIHELFSSSVLYEDLETWLQESSLLKRTFRQVAIISGLTERQSAGKRKTLKQVTFSTDLIFDVLKRYEPQHILLEVTRQEAKRVLLDFERLPRMLDKLGNHIVVKELNRPSPFAISLLYALSAEKIKGGEAEEELLQDAEIEATAHQLIEEVKKDVTP